MNTPTQNQFLGGNSDTHHRNMWEIAKDFNRQSRELNGATTCIRRRNSEGKKVKRILG